MSCGGLFDPAAVLLLLLQQGGYGRQQSTQGLAAVGNGVLFGRFHLCGREFLAGFDGAVLVVRAGRDAVIPSARTQALIEALPRPPQVLELADAGHDDVRDWPAYAATMSAFMENADAGIAPR